MCTSRNFIDLDTKVTFQNLCDVFEKIKNAEAKLKSDVLRKYFNDWRNLKTNPNEMVNMYGILRLLVPQYERVRGPYGIKENTFAKIYIRILNLPKNGLDAQKLLNYKAPSSSTAISADFADVAFWVLKSRCKVKSTDIYVDKINMHLDQIASSHANNQPRSVDDELTKLFGSMTALQQKWLIRIILKELKLGMGQMKILFCFHPDAPDLYDSSNDLLKLCTELHDPKIRLNEIEIVMYAPYRPMLSEKLDIAKIKSAMKREESYYLEMKFDGERFQIHMQNGVFKYFSRNAFDYTQQFGETYESDGSLTKKLKKLLNVDVHSFIIDGEMMGWHKEKKMFSSKGINFDVKKITDESVFQPCFCAFDILLYNDIILTNKPLKERVEYLDRLFIEEQGVFMHSKREETQDSEKVIQNLNKAIDNEEEGIVLKKVMSIYKPNNRKGGWFKIKPEYTEGVMKILDLLIIGGYFVENKRYSEIGSVLLGVADTLKNEKNDPVKFYSVGKVKLTLNKEETEELCGKLQPHWNKVQKDTNPSTVLWSKDKPDVWIEPENSFILEIKASELVKSSAFITEYTVRFPRIENIKYHKPWYDCLTIKEFEDLTKHSHGVEKLTSRNIGEDDIEHPGVSPRKKMKLLNVAPQFRPTNLEGLVEKSNIFSGKEFCIITGSAEMKKSDLELKVVENGGQVVQNPGKKTFCIIAGDKNFRVMNAMKSGEHNIATVDWFLNTLKKEHISSGELLQWTPRDLIGTSLSVKENFVLKYDKYGDSYTEPTNIELLKYSMNQIEDEFETQRDILPSQISQIDLEIFKGSNPYSFLRSCNIYVFEKNRQRIDIKILKIEIVLYGGTYSDSIDPETSHILISSIPNDSEICEMKNQINLYKCKPKILTMDWIFNCIKEKSLLDTCDYKLNFIIP